MEYRSSNKIEIYLVKDGQIDYYSDEINLEDLDLEKTPWLRHSDIEFYDWSSHIFYLNRDLEKEKNVRKYFVVTNNKEPLFSGYFFSMVSSYIPMGPTICATDGFFFPKNVVSLNGFGLPQGKQTLNEQSNFRAALENAGFLREGISVTLEDVKRKSSTKIEYSYTITNNDKEIIYVLDPNKMGASRFHYYTNGVSFRQGNKSINAENKSVVASEGILSRWYIGVLPEKSISRKVVLDGFENLPVGNVDAYFAFPGSSNKSGNWRKSGGRIWLGTFRIEKEVFLN